MREEVFKLLVLSEIYALQARSGGSGRDATINGYSAIDAALSALLKCGGRGTIKEHDRKLRRSLELYPGILARAETTEEELNQLLIKWLRVRYSDHQVTPRESLETLRLMDRVLRAVVEEICQRTGDQAERVFDDIQIVILGSTYPAVTEAVSEVHDHIEFEIERSAEEGDGYKLSSKLLNASRFCDLFVHASDDVSKILLAENEALARRFATIYKEFVDAADTLQMARLASGLDLDEAVNFSLSLRLGYNGLSVRETAEEFSRMLSEMEEG